MKERVYKTIKCDICGRDFSTNANGAKYCSNECRDIAEKKSKERAAAKKVAEEKYWESLYKQVKDKGKNTPTPYIIEDIEKDLKIVRSLKGEYGNKSLNELEENLESMRIIASSIDGFSEYGKIPGLAIFIKEQIINSVSPLIGPEDFFCLKEIIELYEHESWTDSWYCEPVEKDTTYPELFIKVGFNKWRYCVDLPFFSLDKSSTFCDNFNCPKNRHSLKYGHRCCSLMNGRDTSYTEFKTVINCDYRKLRDNYERTLLACGYLIARRIDCYKLDDDIHTSLCEVFFHEKMGTKKTPGKFIKLIRENCHTFIKKDFYSKNKDLIDRFNSIFNTIVNLKYYETSKREITITSLV